MTSTITHSIGMSGLLSQLLRRMAERAWQRAGTHGDRAFLVVGSTYWHEPRVSQHDVARTFAARGPTIFLEPAWKGNRRHPAGSSSDDGPLVFAGPSIPRGLRFWPVAHLNMLLGLATWRALVEAAPADRRLVTWVSEFRFAPLMQREGYRPPFVFHNGDVQTDGKDEGRMAALGTLCACSSSVAADLVRPFNPRTITIGHGVHRKLADLAAKIAQQRQSAPGVKRTVGFVGLWDTGARIDVPLVRRVLATHPDLTFEVTTPRETISDLAAEFPGRVRPLGFLSWPEILQRTLQWDAAVVPYDVTRPIIYYSCPYKIFPLLAAAVPIVCVDIVAVRGLVPHLYVAGDADQFVALAGNAIRGELSVSPEDATAFREQRTWDQILDRVLRDYDEALPQVQKNSRAEGLNAFA